MADKETGELRPKSYRRIRWERAWNDTQQFVLARTVWGVGIAIGSGLMAFPVWLIVGMPINVETVFAGIVITFMATGAMCLVCILYYWLTTPGRMYWEDQKKITDLEGQVLERKLDVSVKVPYVQGIHPPGFRGLWMSRDGLVIFLRNIDFTNRSRTNSVSLEVKLLVALHSESGKEDYLTVREERWHWEEPPSCLFSPIGIGPQQTKAGDMCFLVLPEVVRGYGGLEMLDLYHCRLDVVDRVSGEKLETDISQELVWGSKTLDEMVTESKQDVTKN